MKLRALVDIALVLVVLHSSAAAVPAGRGGESAPAGELRVLFIGTVRNTRSLTLAVLIRSIPRRDLHTHNAYRARPPIGVDP